MGWTPPSDVQVATTSRRRVNRPPIPSRLNARPPSEPVGRELKLADAGALCRAALARAEAEQALVSVAVVDAGGNLVAFGRMDGAEIAGPTLATDKAFTAVALRVDTARLAVLAAPGGELAGLASNGGGRYVIFGGGVPIWVEGRIAGGIGVSGGSVEQDMACAEAASRVWDERCSSE